MKLSSLYIQVPFGWVVDKKGKFETVLGNFLISHLIDNKHGFCRLVRLSCLFSLAKLCSQIEQVLMN